MDFSQDWSGQQVGDYRLLRRLGAGSFGEVYQAEDLREHSWVAVKLIKASLTGREDLKAFLNEARSIRLRHPHIMPLLDFGLSEQDLPFLVMEYVPGGTLRDRYPKGSKVPLEGVVDLTTQLASALQYAHDCHLVHRDVKPENMLCRTDGTVLLSDFGIASVAHASSSVNAYQSFGGTLPYMAPEQLVGKPRPASDQYALAVVIYEWLVGARPFQGTVPELVSQHLHAPPPSLRDQVPMLPIAVEQAVFKALSKQPQERFPRVDDFATALQVACPSCVVLPLAAPSSSQRPPTPNLLQPFSDQATPSVQAKEGFSPSPVPPIQPLLAKANQPASTETPAAIPFSSSMIVSAEVPTSPLTPAPVSHTAQHRGVPNRHVLFTLFLMLLIAFGGGSFYYFEFIAQRIPTLSPVQAIAATATAAARAYATGTARQGVMFGFDAAHTHYNPYEHTIGPGTVSHLTSLWSTTKDSFLSEVAGGDITSSPTVAGGTMYIGSDDHKLYAFDATCRANCQPLWSFATEFTIDSSPAIADGMVYVTSNDGKLYAFGLTS